MKILKIASLMLSASLLMGCAAPAPKSRGEISFGAKPTMDQAMVKIRRFLNTALIDPESARINCAEPTDEAYIWPGVSYDLDYGYLVICQVNAKNRMGGYTGAKRFVFLFNGDRFVYHDVIPRMGLVSR